MGQNNTDLQHRLYGREHDIDKICIMLHEPQYRLITLVGSGGIGKTHLAKQIAGLMQKDFKDGVHFISLQPITASEYIFPAIIETLGQILHGTEDPKQQLLRYLEDKHLLLVLDNFDHLLDAANEVAEILESTPRTKILLTSREVLNLSHEWVWTVTGLAYPESVDAEGVESYAAIQMFIESARHINSEFSLETELPYVIRLCQLVGGIPLAIKLASSWLRTLSCQELVEEINCDLDILSTRLRDFPDQHRSIRTVFDHSWSRLSEKEKYSLKCLAVFQGRFSREAALEVADASVMVLTDLIEKSLLNPDQTGYYQMHALLRQYTHEKLEEDANKIKEAYDGLARYYGNFISGLYPGNLNDQQQAVVHAMVAELDNIRAAWSRIPQTIEVEKLRKLVSVFGDVYQVKAYYREGLDALQETLAQVEAMPLDIELRSLLTEIQANIGWFLIRLGHIQQAEDLLRRAVAMNEEYHITPIRGLGTDPRIPLGIVRTIQGQYEDAVHLGRLAINASQENNDLPNEAGAWYVLSSAALAQGDYETASDAIRQAIQAMKDTNDRWFIAYLLNQQGQIALAKGDYRTAQRYFEESFDIREDFDDPEGMIAPFTHLAQIAILQADFEQALSFFRKSQSISRQIGDKGWWITATEGLGSTYTAMEDYAQAHTYLVDALQTVAEIELPLSTLRVLSAIARLMIETGSVEQGIQIASFILNHSLSDQETKDAAETILTQYRSTLSPASFSAASSEGQRITLEGLIDDLKHHFPFYTWDEKVTAINVATPQPLIEPLTERELEVLHLLGQGLSNTDIAEHLTVVLGTVKTHNYNIFGKLGVKNRVQAVKKARELNLL